MGRKKNDTGIVVGDIVRIIGKDFTMPVVSVCVGKTATCIYPDPKRGERRKVYELSALEKVK